MSRWAALVLGAAVIATSCGGKGLDADVQAAREFKRFPLYWVGERFEQWDLVYVDGLERRGDFVTFIYGKCTPHDGGQPSCIPPLQIEVFPLCRNLEVVAQAPIWRRRQIRSAPVGSHDSAPVLFTRGAQVKVYRREGTDAGTPFRALRALRSVNRVAPVVGVGGRIPGPARGVLAGTRTCTR